MDARALGCDGKWARAILAQQGAHGLWPGNFHTLSVPRAGQPYATEQALRRLHALGYGAQDAPIARTLDTLRATLCGAFDMPDAREVTHDWGLFTRLMMAGWLRVFLPDDPDACAFADRWAGVVAAAFASGAYDDARYREAYTAAFGLPPRGARFVDFTSFYTAALLVNRLDAATERAYLDYVLTHPHGIYYVYHARLDTPPAFESIEATRYIAALRLLARHGSPQARARLAFAADWLLAHRLPDGGWDMGAAARDGIRLPISDRWRTPARRQADCTAYVRDTLAMLGRED